MKKDKPDDIEVLGAHCGSRCPYLYEVENEDSSVGYSGICKYKKQELDWYDYWLAVC